MRDYSNGIENIQNETLDHWVFFCLGYNFRHDLLLFIIVYRYGQINIQQ